MDKIHFATFCPPTGFLIKVSCLLVVETRGKHVGMTSFWWF